MFSASKLFSVLDTSLLAEVSRVCESHAERMSDEAISIVKIRIPFFIALFFKALYPSRYVAFTGARTKTLAFLPITRTCHFCKQFAAFAKSRTGRSAERNDCFPCKIVCLNKAINRPSGNAPPNGITDENGIIAVPVFHSKM